MDPSHIAGFFDGEGSIGVYHHVNNGVQTGFHLRVQLRQNKTELSSQLFDGLLVTVAVSPSFRLAPVRWV